MKTAVDAIFVGKERKFNRRFLQMMSHYLVEPTPCTPGAAWEKGQVENQVVSCASGSSCRGRRSSRLRTSMPGSPTAASPMPRSRRTPSTRTRPIFEVFEAERAVLIPTVALLMASTRRSASVSKTCLVRFDNNKYSVMSKAVGRPVDVYAYADRIVIKQNGVVVGEHPRRFGRDQIDYDPWHYVAVLAKKPGALRNGAPFKDWVLPGSIEEVQRKLGRSDEGDRQMVEILSRGVDRWADRC